MGKKSTNSKSLMHRMIYSCEEATLKISKSHHQKLTFSEKQRLKFHMAICKPCRDFKIASSAINHGLRHLKRKTETNNTFKLSVEQKEKLKSAILKNEK